ncbi:hypothetical protein TSTA_051390 [Talaromyces stipitatus ATCC 10500]|uniref:Uncharacterized protein n=1 Tax=Talaromyces stipitatus (strain ATCC 10500 / CBS 375.48 / QM 6759 / NRRL 1006) TaxID=441959 RepID=B8MJ41_TALSN|nr:uncharacterized protein TSTA_051390 [Talaromyces stipitatus ATCC 10500]EED15703.1 hypothetical protein TSTA_051390 [Talaromyces stipitatus ATCC 10500]
MEFSEWEVQRRDIDKIFEWMKQTVYYSYLKTYVHVTHSWKEAYNNLKMQVGQGSREIQFLEAIRPLDEAWVTSFEHLIDSKIDDKSLTYKDLLNGF